MLSKIIERRFGADVAKNTEIRTVEDENNEGFKYLVAKYQGKVIGLHVGDTVFIGRT